jgi:hypothetical protein
VKYLPLLLLAGFCSLAACKNINTDKKKLSAEETLTAAAKTPGMNAGVSKFSIEAPAGWQKLDTNLNGVKFTFLLAPSASNGFRANINVISQSMEGNSLDAYFDKNITSMDQYLQNFSAGTKGDKEIHGLPAKWMLYSQTQNGHALDGMFYMIAKDGIAYIITFAASKGELGKYKASIDEAIGSFRIQ